MGTSVGSVGTDAVGEGSNPALVSSASSIESMGEREEGGKRERVNRAKTAWTLLCAHPDSCTDGRLVSYCRVFQRLAELPENGDSLSSSDCSRTSVQLDANEVGRDETHCKQLQHRNAS